MCFIFFYSLDSHFININNIVIIADNAKIIRY